MHSLPLNNATLWEALPVALAVLAAAAFCILLGIAIERDRRQK